MYTLVYNIAVFISIVFFIYFNRKQIPVVASIIYGITVSITGVFGSRVLSIIENYGLDYISIDEILDNNNGLTFYGGYIPLFILTLLFLSVYYQGNVLLKQFCFAIIVFHVGYALGRLACHFAADGCYGKITFSDLGIRYTWGEHPTLFPVYPVPLFESVLNFVIAIILFVISKRGFYKQAIYLSLLFFPLSRFFFEYIRNNPVYNYGLTFNQLISISLIIIQPIIFYFYAKQYMFEAKNSTLSICDDVNSIVHK